MLKFGIFIAILLALQQVSANHLRHSQFTSDVISQLAPKHIDENLIISPLSIQCVLTFAALGANGETLQDLQDVAHLKPNQTKRDMFVEFESLMRHIKIMMPIANAIYINKQYPVKLLFKDLSASALNSVVENVDFSENVEVASKVNDWVARITRNNIKTLIDSSQIESSTTLLLLNAIYMKIPWLNHFPITSTQRQNFFITETERVEVEMMHHDLIETLFCNSTELDVTAVQIALQFYGISMLIILPNKIEGLSKLVPITLSDVQKLNSSCENRYLEVSLPKFNMEFAISLKDTLEELGLTKTLSTANFSAMLETNQQSTLVIDDVLHKAFINVDEYGINAINSINTRTNISETRAPFRNQHFLVDHPFAFSIQNNELVYMMGHVVRPTYPERESDSNKINS